LTTIRHRSTIPGGTCMFDLPDYGYWLNLPRTERSEQLRSWLGLTLAGLEFGLVVGLIAGFLSFIPYVGSMVGLVLSVGLALAQFDSYLSVAIVAGVFFIGQAIEGNVLTPKLVGERVGLHPVWVMFALLAGGALFGFVGVLLAVPVAAIVGVGVRFALGQYRLSPYYTGKDETAASSAPLSDADRMP